MKCPCLPPMSIQKDEEAQYTHTLAMPTEKAEMWIWLANFSYSVKHGKVHMQYDRARLAKYAKCLLSTASYAQEKKKKKTYEHAVNETAVQCHHMRKCTWPNKKRNQSRSVVAESTCSRLTSSSTSS